MKNRNKTEKQERRTRKITTETRSNLVKGDSRRRRRRWRRRWRRRKRRRKRKRR